VRVKGSGQECPLYIFLRGRDTFSEPDGSEPLTAIGALGSMPAPRPGGMVAQTPYIRHTIFYKRDLEEIRQIAINCRPPFRERGWILKKVAAAKKTTIRRTMDDGKILEELRQLTGLKDSQLYRAGLRALLRRVKGTSERAGRLRT
jgi:hypothetical protein